MIRIIVALSLLTNALGANAEEEPSSSYVGPLATVAIMAPISVGMLYSAGKEPVRARNFYALAALPQMLANGNNNINRQTANCLTASVVGMSLLNHYYAENPDVPSHKAGNANLIGIAIASTAIYGLDYCSSENESIDEGASFNPMVLGDSIGFEFRYNF